MTEAKNIWDRFSSGKIDAEEAFQMISDLLSRSKGEEALSLMDLSAKILDCEVPMNLRDAEVESIFWAKTKHGEED